MEENKKSKEEIKKEQKEKFNSNLEKIEIYVMYGVIAVAVLVVIKALYTIISQTL